MQEIFKSNFIEIALRHGCSPVNLLHILRTPFLKNTSGWLLLAQLVGQYRLFGIPFHIPTNCSHFIELNIPSLKAGDKISHTFWLIRMNKTSFFIIVFSFKLKSTGPTQAHLPGIIFQCSRNLLVKFQYKIKHPTPLRLGFVKVVEIIQKVGFSSASWFTLLVFQSCYAIDLRETSVVTLK